jgi:transcription-repair coupling factor (superfamily II helicase)
VSVCAFPLRPRPASKQTWGNLPGAALSLAIAEAPRQPSASLAADRRQPKRRTAGAGAAFLRPDLPVLHFPDWETLPYDLFSPHQDIISQRIASLYRLPGC